MAYDVARVRGLIPAVGDGWIHLDATAGMQVPDQVVSAMTTAFRAAHRARVAATLARVKVPVFVMIRPRGGDFLYDDAEFEVMRRDIEHCVRLGCDGVVIGALDADGAVEVLLGRAHGDGGGRGAAAEALEGSLGATDG